MSRMSMVKALLVPAILIQSVSFVYDLPPLVYMAVLLATLWYWLVGSRVPEDIPPLPAPHYPMVGHLPYFLKVGMVPQFHQWIKSTGLPMFSIYSGQKLVVVINDLKTMKEAFVKQGDHFTARPESYITKNLKDTALGVLSGSGPNWKEQRTTAMTILRRFGMGKNFLAEKISEEVEAYLNALSEFQGQPTDVRILTNTSVSNVICAILIGKRFQFDDAYFVDLIRGLNEQVAIIGNGALINVFHWLKYIPGDAFNGKRLLKNINQIRQFCLDFISKAKEERSDDEKEENFINAYLDEIEEKTKQGKSTYLDENKLKIVVANLFAAGTETTSTTLLWAMLFAIHHPDAQNKVYQEIVDVVGTDHLPSNQDRSRLKYTNAYIMETQRMGSILPQSLPHMCTKTTQVAGYTIPEGTTVLPNLDAVHKDPEIWHDPLVFRPERFLADDGSLLVPDEFIPFSLGRRACLGEALAKMELFLFMSGIFQRFHIKPENPDTLPCLEPVYGATASPQRFKPMLVERQSPV